ncbi:hypothetical protein ACTQ4Q_11700, partial [Bacillota bacterium LCP21S3_D9]
HSSVTVCCKLEYSGLKFTVLSQNSVTAERHRGSTIYGVSIKWERNNLHIQKKGDIKGLNIEVTPTTIQSDHQPFFVLLSLYGSTDCYIIVITPFFLVQKTYQRIKQFLNITI